MTKLTHPQRNVLEWVSRGVGGMRWQEWWIRTYLGHRDGKEVIFNPNTAKSLEAKGLIEFGHQYGDYGRPLIEITPAGSAALSNGEAAK